MQPGALSAWQRAIASPVRGYSLRVHVGYAGRRGNAERDPQRKHGDAIHLPSADHCVLDAPRAVQELLAPPEWQFEGVARHKALSHIKRRKAAIGFGVARPLDRVATDVRAGVKRFAPRIGRHETEPGCE